MAKRTEGIKTTTDSKPTRKVGRPRAYTPEALEAKFEEYVEWVKANPRYSNKVLADGSVIPVPYERPLTLSSFAVFAGIVPETFRNFEEQEEYFGVCARVRARIESDQLEGAMCEQYNPTIASRVLHLADRQDVTTNGKEITVAIQPISVVLDPEAAKIIQSIGKMTVKE